MEWFVAHEPFNINTSQPPELSVLTKALTRPIIQQCRCKFQRSMLFFFLFNLGCANLISPGDTMGRGIWVKFFSGLGSSFCLGPRCCCGCSSHNSRLQPWRIDTEFFHAGSSQNAASEWVQPVADNLNCAELCKNALASEIIFEIREMSPRARA